MKKYYEKPEVEFISFKPETPIMDEGFVEPPDISTGDGSDIWSLRIGLDD